MTVCLSGNFLPFLQVIIEGVIGNGFRSDISIDLVSVLPLECSKLLFKQQLTLYCKY